MGADGVVALLAAAMAGMVADMAAYADNVIGSFVLVTVEAASMAVAMVADRRVALIAAAIAGMVAYYGSLGRGCCREFCIGYCGGYYSGFFVICLVI
jgi:hypothetical protein